MDWWIGSALCLPATLLAGVVGYLYGKNEERKTLLGTESGAAMVNVNQQLAEIKGKFEAIEKSRLERENMEAKLQEEKDKTWKQMVENTNKNEHDRLGQVQKAVEQVGQFQKLLLGTQARGNSAEQILKAYLKDLIKQGLVITDVSVGDNMRVEFAWKLNDGKYLPIDSKCHDVLEQVKIINENDDPEAQKISKNKIRKKVESSLEEVKKYQSLTKTIRYCIVAVPESVFDIIPELVSYAISQNVLLTSYSNVAIIAYLTAERYNSDLEKGDVANLEQIVQELLAIVQKIQDKTDTIERGIKMVKNANEEICSEVNKANRIG